MMVWGGYNGTDLNNGGRYDPIADTWESVSTLNRPFSGSYPTSIWTGSNAVIWGGTQGDGGRYDPALDTWSKTTTLAAPPPRIWNTAVWTGSFMIVWDGSGAYGTGGRYSLGHSVDHDGDGYSEGTGDCNDGNPAVNPGVSEICDGRDNNCDGLSDEIFGDADGDLMGDACDCASADPSAFGVPGEVRDVDWPSSMQLSWRSMAESAGSGTVYDVVRGRIGEWPVGSGPSEVCLESGSIDTVSWDLAAPPERFYYLVRGRNACGLGIYGRTSSGAEQSTPACP